MARGKRIIGIDAVNQQIEAAEAEVIKAKKKYDEATDKLKNLLDKKKALQTLRAYFREYLMGSNIAVFLSIQSKNSRNTPLFPCGTV